MNESQSKEWFDAIASGDVSSLEDLWPIAKLDMASIRSNRGRTSVGEAIAHEEDGLVWLLEKGFDPNERGTPDGLAPLHICLAQGPGWAMNLLRAHGADPRVKFNGTGLLPLFMENFMMPMGVLEKLLEWGATGDIDLQARDAEGNNALHLAAKAGLPKAAGLLLDAGVDFLATNNAGLSPIQVAQAFTRALPASHQAVLAIFQKRLHQEIDASVLSVPETPRPRM